MRYLAIDYGRRRIGLAICDSDETITSPLCVLQNQKAPCQRIAEIVKAENVGAVVLGLPLNMDDSEGPQARLVCDFAERLKKHIEVPIYFQDERLSSFAAEEKLDTLGLSRTDKAERLDAVAAAQILQAFLERKAIQ